MIEKLNLRVVLTIVFVALLGWKLLVPFITDPIERKKEEISAVNQGITDLQNRLGIFVRYMDKIRSFGQTSLPSDVTIAAVRYQEWLRQACQRFGIESPTITVKEPTKVEGLGHQFQATIRTTSTIATVGDLIDALCTARMTHRIVSIKMRDWDSVLSRMLLEIDLEALALSDNPSLDPALFSQTMESRGLGAFLDEHRSFSRFVPPRPKLTEVIASTEQPKTDDETLPSQSKVDVLNAVRLVGIIEKDGSTKALFHDGLNRTNLVIDKSHELRIEKFVAIVDRFENDRVILKYGSKELAVSLGQTLRQGLNAQTKLINF